MSRLPVHAVGYNWLQSNRQSGQHLLSKIQEITGHYRSMGKFCERVVIVTHSMGGLVARACAQLLEAQDLILGVVHGVMPANGAARLPIPTYRYRTKQIRQDLARPRAVLHAVERVSSTSLR